MDILLVNKNHPLPDDYQAEDLIPLKDISDKYFKLRNESLLLNKTAAENLNRLLAAAADAGHTGFIIDSAYRSRKLQADLYRTAQNTLTQPPGCSEHETGLAVDILEYGADNDQLAWITDHAADYGFILRYPDNKEHLTGIPYESWHFRYVGVQVARYLAEYNLCLEEYMHRKYNVPLGKFETKRFVNPNEKIIWDFLMSKFGNPYAVAGLMGNLFAESSLLPNILEISYQTKYNIDSQEYTEGVDNGTYDNFVHDAAGYGLAQWTYHKRKANLLAFAKETGRSIGDIMMQLEFLMIELTTDFKEVYDSIIDSTSVTDASDIVLMKFENPHDQSMGTRKYRAKNSRLYFLRYINKEQFLFFHQSHILN